VECFKDKTVMISRKYETEGMSGCDGILRCYLRWFLFVQEVTGDFTSVTKHMLLCYLCVVYCKLVFSIHTVYECWYRNVYSNFIMKFEKKIICGNSSLEV
jgi:hypothetical protein